MQTRRWHLWITAMIICLFATGAVRAGPLTVIDIIPFVDSREAEQNAEPSLGVNPLNPSEMMTGAFTGQRTDFNDAVLQVTTPYFASTTAGKTWFSFGSLQTVDKSIAWKQDGTAALTATLNPNPGKTNYQLSTFSGTIGFATFGPSRNDFDPNRLPDQPWIRTGPSTPANPNPVYIGYNFGAVDGTGMTASVNVSRDGGTTYTPVTIDRVGATAGPFGRKEDAPQVRLAVNRDTVYAVFTRYNKVVEDNQRFESQVIVVRSDDGGGDGFNKIGTAGNGVEAATTVSTFFSSLGQERVAGDVAIAVDPKDPKHVVVAYGDAPGPNGSNLLRLVVTESTDGGISWTQKFATTSTTTTRQALPGLSILDNGVIGLLYLNYDSVTNQLSQHLLATADDFLHTNDTSLGTEVNGVPAPDPKIGPYLGDFFDMTSVGSTLYGVFSASNKDDGTNANFLNGVTFQRDSVGTPGTGDFALRDGSTLGALIDFSIDPFFFSVNLDDFKFPCGINCPPTDLIRLTLAPEPASLAILGIALAGFGFAWCRKAV
jgi:hypothetical protein